MVVKAGARHAQIDHMHTCVRYTMGWGNYGKRAQSGTWNQSERHKRVLGAPPQLLWKRKSL